MKKYIAIISILLGVLGPLEATITFGSTQSAIKISNNGQFHLGTNLPDVDGTITQKTSGTITGNASTTIGFSQGVLQSNNADVGLTASYDPNLSGQTIMLTGNDEMRAQAGTIIESIKISNANNRITGNPSFNDSIILQDASTTLTVAMQSVLNQNIEFNESILTLDDDLRLADGIVFNGTGTVRLNKRQLSFGGSDATWTGTTYWDAAQDIAFRSNTDLRGMWIFHGDAFMSGESTILDLTHGGTIWIKPNSALYITQVKIRGIGNGIGQGTVIFEDNTSKMYMRRSALEFLTTYTFDRGQIITEVGSSKMIVRDHDLWVEAPGVLKVDGVNLFYNTRTFPNNNNIKSSSTGPIQLINNGRILHFRSFEDYTNNTSEGGELGANKFLGDGGSSATLTIISTFPEFDGKGWYMHFSRDPLAGSNIIKMLTLEGGVNGVLKHVVLKDFSSDYLSIPNSSTLIFGDKTTIELAEDEDLKMTWTFQGECIIDGNDKVLSLENGGALDVQNNVGKWGKSSSLLLKNMTIKGLTDHAIRCLDNTGTITFQNVILQLSNNYTMTMGHFEVLNDVKVQKLSGADNAKFIYNVDGVSSTIHTGGVFYFDRNTTFSYDPASSDNDLLALEDETAVFALNGATLFATDVGLQLIKGTLLIDHKCFVESDATMASQAVSFGDGANASNDLQIDIMPGGNVDVIQGILHYNNVAG